MQPLEKKIKRSQISKKIETYNKEIKRFYETGPSISHGKLTYSDLVKIKAQHELLKKEVVQRLMDKKEEYADLYDKNKEYTNNRIKIRDIKILYEYVLARTTFRNRITVKESILSKNYCNHCGLCCIETENIEILPKEYKHMIKVKPELAKDIIGSKMGLYKFKEEKPCKFFNDELKKCEIYDLRPTSCRDYPCHQGNIIFAGDCEYMVRYMFEECKNLLIECLQK